MKTYGFIGFGLIGGSIAGAIREMQPDARIIAWTPRPDRLSRAVEENVVDLVFESGELLSLESEDRDSPLRSCDIVFLCAPVQSNLDYLPALLHGTKSDSIVTDVGSVKTPIVEAALSCGLGDRFVGGHPMTGSEKSGVENSSPAILKNALWFLTPTMETNPDAVDSLQSLVVSLSACPILLPCEEHDRTVAGVSHLPHILASSLVNTVKVMEDADGTMRRASAGGFRDITRIASSSPEVWKQICLTNRSAILEALDRFSEALSEMRTNIADGNGQALFDAFASARDYRNSTEFAPGHREQGDSAND